ncbi:MAG: hypothetical protein JRI68_23500 [Deltaproteobacteria bacterium]|nr:hypothetical protein [Deltaproteobacteria bacterium]
MKKVRAWLALTVGLVGAGTVIACASSDEASMDAGYGSSGIGGGTSSGASSASSSGWGGAGGYIPPEEELESSYGAPVATGNYVWITNPDSGRVAFIDATTLEIEVVDAGHGPTYLAGVPDAEDDVAVVLNVLSYDATVLRASADGELTATTLPVPAAGNRWAISQNGRWATAWTDARDIELADPIDGYQDMAVLDLEEDTSTSLTVGYRPVALGYDDAGTSLFAVTEDGVSVVDLTGSAPTVIKNVPLSDDPFEDTASRDVAITPDGAFALVRRDGEAAVTVVDLDDGTRIEVVLPAPVTDLDLSPDGTVAVAVVRDTSQVALLPLPAIVSDPFTFPLVTVETVTIGSVALAPESSVAFFYTNAIPSSALTVFDSAAMTPVPKYISLHAAVKAVFPTPDATHAVVLHDTTSGGWPRLPCPRPAIARCSPQAFWGIRNTPWWWPRCLR